MFPTSSSSTSTLHGAASFADLRGQQDRNKPSLLHHSQSTSNLNANSFSSFGNTFSTGGGSGNPGASGGFGSSVFGQSHGQGLGHSHSQSHSDILGGFGHSRPTYLPGYLMSATQGLPLPDGAQRFDDPPLLPTKSKAHIHGKESPAFGLESTSSFDRSKARKNALDDDGPPTNSVYDSMDESYDYRQRATSMDVSTSPSSRPALNRSLSSQQQVPQQIYYIIVFGFPQERVKQAIQFFSSIGETTEPEMGPEGSNWFKIGYKNSWEAARAVRKNGEVMNGTWMVGVKWADQAQAEALLSASTARLAQSSSTRGAFPSSNTRTGFGLGSPPSSPPNQPGMSLPGLTRSTTTSFGRAANLAPSSSAFRKPQSSAAANADNDWGVVANSKAANPDQQPQPGMLGKLGDMIFGW